MGGSKKTPGRSQAKRKGKEGHSLKNIHWIYTGKKAKRKGSKKDRNAPKTHKKENPTKIMENAETQGKQPSKENIPNQDSDQICPDRYSLANRRFTTAWIDRDSMA